MTNKELIAQLSERLGWTQIKVSEVLAQTIEQVNAQLANNSLITIQNFGTFQTRKRAERISVNFKPSTVLKEKYK